MAEIKTSTGVKIILAAALIIFVLPIYVANLSNRIEKVPPTSLAERVVFWTPLVAVLLSLCIVGFVVIALLVKLARKCFRF